VPVFLFTASDIHPLNQTPSAGGNRPRDRTQRTRNAGQCAFSILPYPQSKKQTQDLIFNEGSCQLLAAAWKENWPAREKGGAHLQL